MTSPRLLVLSPPCHQPVNRAVYRELVRRHGIAVNLVVPRRLCVGGKWRETPHEETAGSYDLTMLDIAGTHQRLQRMRGISAVVHQWKPTHILVDADPASLMVWSAVRAAKHDVQVWALTAENMRPHYLQEVVRGLTTLRPASIAGPAVTLMLRVLLHRKVDRVFTLSEDGTKAMEAVGFRGRATQIPLGFDAERFTIQPPERIAATRTRLRLTQPTVAYFGRLTPEKGVHLLLQALATIRGTPWQLLIDNFGDYETGYTAELRALIDTLGLRDRVVHFDAKHEEMPNYMNAADVVVLPSISTPKWKEQYGRVLPEAMACGKVVIGSNSGAIPDLIAGYGHVVAEGDVTALAACISQVLQSSEHDREEAGRRASSYAHARLSAAVQADIWARLLVAQAA